MEAVDDTQKKPSLKPDSTDPRRSRDSSRSSSLRVAGQDRPPKFTPKFKQLIDDYTKLYKEHQELSKENTRLQTGIARYFKEHLQDPKENKKAKTESKEEKERNAGEAEEEHQRRYESGFRVVKDLNKKIAVTKDEAQARSDKMKAAAAAKEVDVQTSWKMFQEKLRQFAKQATTRDGQVLPVPVIDEHLEKIDAKLAEWRQVGLTGALIMRKKEHREEQLRALDNFGGDMSLNHFDELKALSRLHQEKNDESLKDLEASRVKQAHSSQIVAHQSEKVFYLSILKKELVEKLEWLEGHLAEQREKLNHIKISRDQARKEGQEIREGTGIMFTHVLLHDLDAKIKIRNQLVTELRKTNHFLQLAVKRATQALPVDPVQVQLNMARGDLPLLPETYDDDESMDIICAYDGTNNNFVGTNNNLAVKEALSAE